MSAVSDAAIKLHKELGFAVIPIKPRSKIPYDKGWPSLRLDTDGEIEQAFAKREQANVSFLPGSPSGDVVDIDLDAMEAVSLAPEFLPPTGRVFGREGKPRSHWLYKVSGSYKTAKFTDPEQEVKGEHGMIVEFRADGAQTVVPPSTHTSGEVVRWDSEEEMAEVDAEVLRMAVARLAAAALLARYWPKQGTRQQLALSLAGGLLRDGLDEEEVEHFVRTVAREADDEEAEERRGVVSHTAAKIGKGQNVTGWPSVSSTLGDKVAARLHDFITASLPQEESLAREGKPVIYTENEDMVEGLRLAWTALEKMNEPPSLFVHISGEKVRLTRTNEDLVVEALTTETMRFYLAHAATFIERQQKRDKVTYPPTVLCNALLSDPNPHLPLLRRIVRMPTYGPDGLLHSLPGYNPDTHTFYDPEYAIEVDDVPEEPTEGIVEWAKEVLGEELLGDFPFKTQTDKTNAISMIVLPFVRDMISGPTPLHLWEAPAPGTGKSLAATAALVPSVGREVSMMSETKDGDEWRKRILAALRENQEAIFIDNVNQMLSSSSLASVLTTNTFSDRVLGQSKTASIPVRSIWVVTANNPSLTTEIARRCVQIRLDSKEDRPWLREGFKHPALIEWAVENRANLIRAVLILVNNWIAKGKPRGSVNMGSFESWSAVMSGIMESAGYRDFMGNMMNLYETADVEGAAWREFVETWYEKFGTGEVTTGDLFLLAIEIDGLYTGKGGMGDKGVFGRLLSKQRDRVIGGYQIVLGRSVKRAARYHLVSVLEGVRGWSSTPAEERKLAV
ncbi:MAG: bifunctional DNA primase/polymerase [Anaerolineae bacterium]